MKHKPITQLVLDAPKLLPAPRKLLVTLQDIPADVIRRVCGTSKLRMFEIKPTFGPCKVTHYTSYPYKGTYKSYPKHHNVAHITSYCSVSSNMLTLHHALFPAKVLRAPAGMLFTISDAKLVIVRTSDRMDYHPTLFDLLAKDFATRVRKQMTINWQRRRAIVREERNRKKKLKENARVQKLFQRDLSNTYVTLSDSRAVGNCSEGTLTFAERKLKIQREEILAGGHLFAVRADKIMANANGETEKATRACFRAWQRETVVSI